MCDVCFASACCDPKQCVPAAGGDNTFYYHTHCCSTEVCTGGSAAHLDPCCPVLCSPVPNQLFPTTVCCIGGDVSDTDGICCYLAPIAYGTQFDAALTKTLDPTPVICCNAPNQVALVPGSDPMATQCCTPGNVKSYHYNGNGDTLYVCCDSPTQTADIFGTCCDVITSSGVCEDTSDDS